MQLPDDYKELAGQAALAQKTWSILGLSYRDLEDMDFYELEMLKLFLE